MKKKARNIKYNRRLLVFVSTSLVVISFICIYIGKYYIQIIEKYQEHSYLTEKLIELKKEEEKLSVDVERLQDPDYVARYAREKYLYSKDGEFIIKLP